LAKVGATVTDKVSGGEAFITPFMISMADDHYALDISRARKLLGWQPKHRLLERLSEIIDNLKRDPDHWYANNGIEK
jgi:UDP-glucose 4-epimerase